MRNRADLEGAFELLKRQVDDYSTARDLRRFDTLDSTVLELVFVPQRRAPRLKIAAALTAAAAVVVALTVAVIRGNSNDVTPAAGSVASVDETIRTVPFTIDPRSGFTLIEASLRDEFSGFQLVSRTAHVQVSIGSSSTFPGTHSAKAIRVNGHPGYWSPGIPPHTGNAVVWQYAAHKSALITAEGMTHDMTEPELMGAADALDFSQPTAVLIPFSMRRAPTGMTLTALRVAYRIVGGEGPPFPLTSPEFTVDALYQSVNHRRSVHITLTNSPRSDAPADTTAVQVGNRTGHYSKRTNALFIDYGDSVTLQVDAGQDGSPGKDPTTLAELRTVAGTVQVVDHPNNQHVVTEWCDAGTLS